MSSDAIDRMYEEDLQAEPRLLLHVDGRLRRVEPNTPEGRQAIDKAALRYSETSDDVTVNREGVRKGAGGRDGVSIENEVVSGLPPKPAKTTGVPASLRSTFCCKPSVYPGPSGIRYRHAFSCPKQAGQVFVTAAAVRDPLNLAGRLQAETLRTGLDDAIKRHPAGGTLTATTDRCPVHDTEGAWDCVECSQRGHPGW